MLSPPIPHPANNPQFFFFAAINVFSAILAFFLPETQGRSLESMDVLFGSITQEQRDADIARHAATRLEAEKNASVKDGDLDEKDEISGQHRHIERV
jgi:hypothetical protein